VCFAVTLVDAPGFYARVVAFSPADDGLPSSRRPSKIGGRRGRAPHCEVEGEVLVLLDAIDRLFALTALSALTLGFVRGGTPAAAAPLRWMAASTTGAEPPALAKAPEAAADAKPGAPAPAKGEQGPCPPGMVIIDGDHCPEVEQTCLKWLDPPPYENLRCGEYAKPTKCKTATKHRRFCIDREEYAEATTSDPKDALPIVNKSWLEAKALCEARGARLCKEAEWELACEGPEMSPYPYGWKRDSTICNLDRTDLGGAMEKLTDHRAPLSAFPRCVSPYGVHDIVGNVDEWVEREGVAPPHRSALRGGWWLPGRNRCRAATLHHGEEYSAKQVGFRCCADAPAAAPSSSSPSASAR
jgi:hypothetical protein